MPGTTQLQTRTAAAPATRPQQLPTAQTGMTLEEALEIARVDRAEFVQLYRVTFRKARSLEELATLIAATKRRGLDGFLHHVYFEQFGGSNSEPSLHVAIDGLRAIAAHTGRYAGALEPRFSGTWDMPVDERGTTKPVPEKATVAVYAIVQGHRVPFEGTAFMAESYPGTGGRGRMWRERPRGMLAIAAERQALRRAFPAETAGVGDYDAGTEDLESPPPEAQPPSRTKVAENAATYNRIYEPEDDSPKNEAYVKPGSELADKLAEVVQRAAAAEVDYQDLHVALPAPTHAVQAAIAKLEERVRDAARAAEAEQMSL